MSGRFGIDWSLFWWTQGLFLALWAAVFAVVLWRLIGGLRSQRRAAAWRAVPGRITDSAVAMRGGGSLSLDYVVRVAYAYVMDGTAYRGYRIAFGGGPYAFAREAEAAAFIARYPVGAAVTVHADPDDPRRAVLLREVRARGLYIACLAILGGVFLLAEAAFLFVPDLFGRAAVWGAAGGAP